jgi:hypothetical protein
MTSDVLLASAMAPLWKNLVSLQVRSPVTP